MSFVRPELLWLAAMLPALVLFAVDAYARRRRRVARQLGDAALLRRLTTADLSRIPSRRYMLLGLAAAALGIAAAGPRWGFEEVDIRSRSFDLVLAIDVSRSMLARDVAPDRLERSRLLARRVLGELSGDRIGLVAFAGRAYVMTPPTVDHSAVNLYLDALDPEIVSQGGSSLSAALRQAADLARGEAAGARDRVVLLISDGEAHDERDEVLAAADRARQVGVVIHTVGVGSAEGATIPVRGGGVQRGPQGDVVLTRLDEALLREVARRSGGTYTLLTGGSATERVLASFHGLTRDEREGGTRVQPVERYTWFVLAALLLLAADGLTGTRREGRGRSPAAVPGRGRIPERGRERAA